MPAVLMLVFAATRWPGLMPANFSAAYALAFCAGVYFGKWSAWLLPLTTLLLTDVLLNLHYGYLFHWHQIFNYVGYFGLIGMGRILGANASALRLLTGSLAWRCFLLFGNQYRFVVFQSFSERRIHPRRGGLGNCVDSRNCELAGNLGLLPQDFD